MVRIELNIELQYEIDAQGADFVFNIHAAHTAHQRVSAENLVLSQAVDTQIYTDPFNGNRYMRLRAWPGSLKVQYSATVDLTHHFCQPDQIAEVPVCQLPPEVMEYI